MWPRELSSCVDDDLVASLGKDAFESVMKKARVRCGNPGSAKMHSMFIGAKLAYVANAGAASPTLDRLCESLLALPPRPAPQSQYDPAIGRSSAHVGRAFTISSD